MSRSRGRSHAVSPHHSPAAGPRAVGLEHHSRDWNAHGLNGSTMALQVTLLELVTAVSDIAATDDYAPTLDIVGEQLTVLASGEATEGYEVFLQRGPEGSGPPPHSHPWDESFYVVKGRIDFGIGPDATTATAGTLVHLPAGTVHWFRFGEGGGEMVSMTSRLGASKMFADMAREVSPANPDLVKLTEVGARHGLTLAV